MTTLRFKLAIRPSRRYPGWRVRVAPGKLKPDEKVLPILLKVSDAWLTDRSPTIVIDVPEPKAPTAQVEEQ